MPAAWKIVRLLSAVGVRCVVTLMHRNETVIVVYLHGIGIVDYLDTLADILYRYAVVMQHESHITVSHHCHGFAFLHNEAVGR